MERAHRTPSALRSVVSSRDAPKLNAFRVDSALEREKRGSRARPGGPMDRRKSCAKIASGRGGRFTSPMGRSFDRGMAAG